MAGVNKAILVGNLGGDPETRYTQSGTAVCNFTLATSEKRKNKQTGESIEDTEWHRVVAWGKTAELCQQYLSKGRQVYIEGRLRTRKWDKNGVTMYTTEVHADSVTFLGGREGGQSPSNSAQGGYGGGQQQRGDYNSPVYNQPQGDDGIPF